MRIRNLRRFGDEKIELQMTPMIDVVFLMLVFFLLTFKIVTPEGDFSVKMPLATASAGPILPETTLPPTKITLRSDSSGRLAGILLGKRSLGTFEEVQEEIRAIVDDAGGPGSVGAEATEVELDCEYQLHFEYVIDAISAVSGYVTGDGRVIKLIEKIRFSPPRAP